MNEWVNEWIFIATGFRLGSGVSWAGSWAYSLAIGPINLDELIVTKQYGPKDKPKTNMAVEVTDMEGSQKYSNKAV